MYLNFYIKAGHGGTRVIPALQGTEAQGPEVIAQTEHLSN